LIAFWRKLISENGRALKRTWRLVSNSSRIRGVPYYPHEIVELLLSIKRRINRKSQYNAKIRSL